MKLVLVFGGTDLNENANQEKQCEVMQKVVEKSSFCVAFSDHMKRIALDVFVSNLNLHALYLN